jgi:putative phosphoesterase
MRYGIIADIHSNLEALEAVMRQLEGKAEGIICLGDIIGYGPNPNECCEIIRRKNIPSVAGNHEKAVLGEIPLEWFNPNAAEAARWTQKEILSENLGYIKGLPLKLDFPEFQIVHGSLADPVMEYLTNMAEAIPTFNLMQKPLLFVGHTHRPLRLKYDNKEIINPGSVGQPRDGDPWAAYLTYDTEKKDAQLFRVNYDIKAVQDKMKAAGLPQFLIERLNLGR